MSRTAVGALVAALAVAVPLAWRRLRRVNNTQVHRIEP